MSQVYSYLYLPGVLIQCFFRFHSGYSNRKRNGPIRVKDRAGWSGCGWFKHHLHHYIYQQRTKTGGRRCFNRSAASRGYFRFAEPSEQSWNSATGSRVHDAAGRKRGYCQLFNELARYTGYCSDQLDNIPADRKGCSCRERHRCEHGVGKLSRLRPESE